MNQKTLVLVERVAHVPEAVRLKQSDPAAVRLVALAPSVMEALTTAGVPYAIPEEFISPAILNQRGRENYRHLERLGDWLETILGELPEPLRLNPVVVHFYRLKLLIDSVSLRVEELAAVFRVEKPDRVMVFTAPNDPLWATPEDYIFITTDGPIYAGVAPLVAEALGLTVEIKPLRASGPRRGKRCHQRLRAWASEIRGMWRWLLSWCWRTDTRPILWQVGDETHDMPDLMEALSERFTVVRWRHVWAMVGRRWVLALLTGRQPRHFVSDLRAFWLRHRAALSRQPIFLAAGINYFPLLEPRLRYLTLVGQRQAARVDQLARHLIRRWRLRAALGVSSGTYQETIVSLALRAEGIPVVYTQEGGLYGYCHWDMYHYRELMLCDYLLAYGPRAADYVNQTRLSPRQRAQAVPVGSIRLQGLRASASAGGRPVKRVMYVPTNDFHHALRYAPLHYSSRQYARIKRQVLETLLEVPGIRIIYKPAPRAWSDDSLRPLIVRHAGHILLDDRPLTQALDQADAFVVDWPTTSLLEVLTTRKPVVVLMDRDVTQPAEEALSLLRRRARVGLDVPSFLHELRRGFSESAQTDDNVEDAAFLEAYGTGGRVAWNRQQLIAFFDSLGPRS